MVLLYPNRHLEVLGLSILFGSPQRGGSQDCPTPRLCEGSFSRTKEPNSVRSVLPQKKSKRKKMRQRKRQRTSKDGAVVYDVAVAA